MTNTDKRPKSAPRQPTAFKLDEVDAELKFDDFIDPMEACDNPLATTDPRAMAPEPKAKPSRWGKVFTVGIGGLVSLSLGLAIDSLLRDLFARYEWLGYIGAGLTALALLGFIGIVAREWRALSRLAQIDHLKDGLQQAADNNDDNSARKHLKELSDLYSERAETAQGRQALQGHLREVIDGRDLVMLAEKDLLGPMDARARNIVMQSAKRVSVVTALSPRALLDIAVVLYENLRIVSRIARLYGARPGVFGYWRLARNVAAHLAVTGGMAVGDSVMEQFIGQGLAARLSARLGEGLVNGFLTARIGLAAIQTCRPSPFIATSGPTIGEFMSEIMKSEEKSAQDAKSKQKTGA